MKQTLLTLFMFSVLLTSCTVSKSSAGFYPTSSRCISVNKDGSQTVMSWGSGSNFNKAIIDAQKNALREILFEGIRTGDQECLLKPLVSEVNAETQFKAYFTNFFKTKGDFKNFVKFDEPFLRPFVRKGLRSYTGLTTSVIVRVNLLDLKNELMKNSIIK